MNNLYKNIGVLNTAPQKKKKKHYSMCDVDRKKITMTDVDHFVYIS